MLLTAGSLAQHLDAALVDALGLFQLTFVGVGGGIGTADGSHQRRAVHSLAHTLSLGWVAGVALADSSKATQHSPAAWKQNINIISMEARLDLTLIDL